MEKIKEKDINAAMGLAGLLCLVGFVFVFFFGCATYEHKEAKGIIYSHEDKYKPHK
mgnify:CR=1 FL=1